MTDELEIKQNKKGRFVWQVSRISKTGNHTTIQSGKDVSWATKHGAKRGFRGHIQAAEKLIYLV